MRKRQYAKRELLGALMYPIIFSLFVLIFICFGLIKTEYSELYSWWTLITILSGIFAFGVSYIIAFKKRR